MKKIYFIFFLLFSLTTTFQSQIKLSVYAEVSIITAGPGEELYSAFGHSAIRIKDPLLKLDLIYNYGIFDFNQPNFYTNFAKGNMIYKLERYNFKYFLASYKQEKRWVKEQILNLNQKQKQAYFTYLENNALPQNKNYRYDPYFNNCATILRDISQTILSKNVNFNPLKKEDKISFRTLTNNQINWNSWGAFGLNLIAGKPLDKIASYEEQMFLPDYTFSAFKEATILISDKNENLVKKQNTLLNFSEIEKSQSIGAPFTIFCIFLLIVVLITIRNYKTISSTNILDFIILFTTGLIGIVLLFLWLFSTHSTAPNNFNILWAFAPNLFVSFLLFKKNKPKWIQQYFKILILLLLLIPILWISRVQVFPLAIIPVLVLLMIRYLFLATSLTK